MSKFDEFNDCPICGGKIWGRGKKVLLEGAKITVCESCASHGEKIPTKSKSSYAKKPYIGKTTPHSKTKAPSPRPAESDLELVPDYSKRIRSVRNKNNLTQEKFAQKLHEKVSLMRRIESGKVEPTIKLAKKIEQTYGITLLKQPDEVDVDYRKYVKKPTGSSLGDIAFIKKKK